MTLRTIATLLTLFAIATACAKSASAEGQGFRGGGFHGRGGGGLHGRVHGRGFHRWGDGGIVVGGYVGLGDYGTAGGIGLGDWYGISSGHDECPLFRKRVMTPDGWRVQMVPVC